MSVAYHVSWLPCRLVTMSVGYHVSWLPCQLVTMSIGYHVSWLPCQLVTMSVGYHLGWLPCRSVTKSVRSGGDGIYLDSILTLTLIVTLTFILPSTIRSSSSTYFEPENNFNRLRNELTSLASSLRNQLTC
jgi:hypothetical protein